ncbi:MAG: F0F1 ATP synthase subunit epsilon [Clostridia bacterium]|nr:F0F1 ATP synthase subunit epsilon [Clostridia bacterium]NCC74807.1 F0F1 ATP synthase subunit epsilon [Clostridia bacterium]
MKDTDQITLVVNIPERIVVRTEHVVRLVADTPSGSHGIWPHRLDFVAPLRPGILTFQDDQGSEHYIALDEGILLKSGLLVQVSARRAVASDDLDSLRERLEATLKAVSEQDMQTRRILMKFEDDFIRLYHEVHRGKA